MKNNMFCVSKKLIFIVGLFFLFLVVFLINTKIKNTKLGTSSKAFGKCSVVLKGGKKYISNPALCCGKSNGYSCGSPFIGSTYLINCQTGLMTKSTSLKVCQEQINKIGIKAGKSRNFPNKPENIITKIPTPTSRPISSPQPSLTPTNIDYVFNVSLNKETDTSYILEMDQLNNGQQNHYKVYFNTVEDNNCYYGYVSIQNLFKDSEKYGLPIRNAVLYFSNDNGFKIKVKDYMTDKYIFTSTIPSSSFNGFIRIYSNLFASAQCYN